MSVLSRRLDWAICAPQLGGGLIIDNSVVTTYTRGMPNIVRFTVRDTRLAQESIALDHKIKELTARKKTIDAELTAKMGAVGATLATYKASTIAALVPPQERWLLDVARIKVELPDVAKEYTKPPSTKLHIQYLLAV